MKLFLILILVLVGCGEDSSSIPYSYRSSLLDSLGLIKNKYQLPGLAAGLYQKDVLSVNVSGIRKVGFEEKLTTEDKFHLGSCSKAMTATLAAIMVEEGHLNWDDTLEELLPDLDIHSDYKNVRFDYLLSHLAGLRHDTEDLTGNWLYAALQSSSLSPTQGRKLYAQSILKLPASHPVGTFSYSNGGYMIAGYILEQLGNMPWETLMKNKLFSPLGMESCGTGITSPSSEFVPTQPWGHNHQTPIQYDNPPAFAPAAGIHCSLHDWSKFLYQHLNGWHGHDGIVSKTSFKKLHTVASGDYTYGGWGVVRRNWSNELMLFHNGTNSLNYARVYIMLESGTVLMTVSNSVNADLATEELSAQMASLK